jgi:hypothetical protein
MPSVQIGRTVGGLFGDGVTLGEYEVPGESHDAVRAGLHAACETITDLHGHEAYAQSWVRVISEGEGSPVTLDLVIAVMLPRLSSDTAPDVANCFARYRHELELHEALHVENARRAFREIVAQIPAGASAAICEALFRQQGPRTLALDAELDARTDHGGPACRFPPPECRHVPPSRVGRRERRLADRAARRRGR